MSTGNTPSKRSPAAASRPRAAKSLEWFRHAIDMGTITVERPPHRGTRQVQFDSDCFASVHALRDALNDEFFQGRHRLGFQMACRMAVWFTYQVLVENRRPGLSEILHELRYLPMRGVAQNALSDPSQPFSPHSRAYRGQMVDTPKVPRPKKPRIYAPRPAFTLPHLHPTEVPDPLIPPPEPPRRKAEAQELNSLHEPTDANGQRDLDDDRDHPGQLFFWPGEENSEDP